METIKALGALIFKLKKSCGLTAKKITSCLDNSANPALKLKPGKTCRKAFNLAGLESQTNIFLGEKILTNDLIKTVPMTPAPKTPIFIVLSILLLT